MFLFGVSSHTLCVVFKPGLEFSLMQYVFVVDYISFQINYVFVFSLKMNHINL